MFTTEFKFWSTFIFKTTVNNGNMPNTSLSEGYYVKIC